MAQQPSVAIPWTTADVTSLANAIKSGARTVEYGEGSGRRLVTYRSQAEMLGLLDVMVRYVNSLGDGQPVVNTRGSVFIRR